MKKLSTATDLGGAPIYKNDLREVFNYEIWAAVEALLSQFNSDTQGIVVQGCVTTANGGNFDMTSGVVYLNGEFMRIPAATNQTFTKYIAPAAEINSTRTFADTTSHVVTIDKKAELVGSIPGSGQYLTISSLTDLDDRRWRPALTQSLDAEIAERDSQNPEGLITVMYTIGNWDMTGTSSVQITHGISGLQAKPHHVRVTIINDSEGLPGKASQDILEAGDWQSCPDEDPTLIVLNRDSGGKFDSVNYNSTPYNRGYVFLTYKP
jgi:hypothetical protein